MGDLNDKVDIAQVCPFETLKPDNSGHVEERLTFALIKIRYGQRSKSYSVPVSELPSLNFRLRDLILVMNARNGREPVTEFLFTY